LAEVLGRGATLFWRRRPGRAGRSATLFWPRCHPFPRSLRKREIERLVGVLVFMARRLRCIPQDGSLVEVTSRTLHGRLLLRPSREVNDMIAGALGRAQRRYEVEIVCYVFLSNHYHLLVRVRDARQLAGWVALLP